MKDAGTAHRALWTAIESCLDSGVPDWRDRIDAMRQVAAVERRSAGGSWSDEEVFEAIVLAVLSAHTDWSKIERLGEELADLFSGFSLKWYAELSETDIGKRFPPWFGARRAGSMTLRRNLVNLAGAARVLREYSRANGTAESYFVSLVDRCRADPKEAALRLGGPGEFKLPTLGVPLAAEALKNLGFDVAKPDRHIMRAVSAFGLADFGDGRKKREGDGGTAFAPTPRRQLLAMTAVQDVAEAAGKRVVFVDNAIWLLCARSGLHLTHSQLADMAIADKPPEDCSDGLGGLIGSWMGAADTAEQRETVEHLIRALDENRLSDRKLFPRELKGKSW